VLNGATETKRKHPEGMFLRAFVEPRFRAVDIARAGGFSRSYVSQVFAGDVKPSPRFLEACRKVGIPVDEALSALAESREKVAV
jgi:hypothetical protein